MAAQRIPGPSCMLRNYHLIDDGTLSRSRNQAPGPLPLDERAEAYSYSISGKPGIIGNMLFTEISQRLPGTLYDRTVSTTQFIQNEVSLGLSEFADKAFRQSAHKMLDNIRAPVDVDVELHIETSGAIETISVRGRNGIRLFIFDLNEAEKRAEKLPKDADPFQVFNGIVNKILGAVTLLR